MNKSEYSYVPWFFDDRLDYDPSNVIMVIITRQLVKAQTILRISTVLSESILLMKYETRLDDHLD